LLVLCQALFHANPFPDSLTGNHNQTLLSLR